MPPDAPRETDDAFRKALFEASALGVAELTLGLAFMRVNASLCALAGRRADELVGTTLAALAAHADRPLLAAVRARFDTPHARPWSTALRITGPDGAPRALHVTLSPIADEAGVTRRLVLVAHPLERTAADTDAWRGALHVLQAAPVALAVFDAERLTLRDGNDLFFALLGVDRKTVEALPLGMTLPFPNDLLLALRGGARQAEGAFFTHEAAVRSVRGRTRDCLLSATLAGENGADLVVVAIDVTEMRIAESLRDALDERLALLLESLSLGVAWKDRHSVYLGANRAALALMGVAVEADLLGRTDADLPRGPSDPDAARALDARVVEEGTPFVGDIEQWMAPSGPRLVRTSRYPVRNAEGDIVALLVTQEDVTRRGRGGPAAA